MIPGIGVASGARPWMRPRVDVGVGAGGGGGAPPPDLLDVDFDGYASTAELIGDTDTWNIVEDNTTSEIALVTAPAGSGYSKAMRYHYNHGSNGCTSITIRRKLDFPTPQQEVWAEFGIRWSANFTTTQTACLPNDHKLIFGDTVAGLNGRWAFHVGADNPPHTLKVATPHRTVGSSYEPGTGIIGSYYPNQSGGLVATDIWETDTWHTIRLHYKSTTTGAVMQVWYDGTLIHDESGFGVGDIDGSPDLIEGFSFCHNKDDGPDDSRDMYIWWSHIKAWSTDPGWSS